MPFSNIPYFYRGLSLENIGKYWKIVKYSTDRNSNAGHAIIYKFQDILILTRFIQNVSNLVSIVYGSQKIA